MRMVNLSIMIFLLLLSGCAADNHAQSGAATGALLGGTTGALIGEHNGDPIAGALIGTAAGALLGESMGAAEDRSTARYEQKLREDSAYRQQHAVTLQQVLEMTRAGVDDQVIVTHIQTKGVAQRLSTDDIILLSKSQVGADVIKAYQDPYPHSSSEPSSIDPNTGSRRDGVIIGHRYPYPFAPTPTSGFHIDLGFGN